MRIALNFLHDGKRKGIWVNSEDLPPETWQKLSGSLVKTPIPGNAWVHVASTAEWSTQSIRDGRTYRPHGAQRFLTGKMLTVAEPTLDAVLAAIDEDERRRLAVPVEPQPWYRHQDLNTATAQNTSHRVAPGDGDSAWKYAKAKAAAGV